MKRFKNWIHNIFYKYTFLCVLFSPFKRFKLECYIGKIKNGTPHFLPRHWIKNTDKPGYLKSVPKRIGFDFVGLGWKTKFGEYRFESAPIFSFVFLKWQCAITFRAPHEDHYWESWLYYHYDTDKTTSKYERIKECIKEYPQNWITYKNKIELKINYYDLILKNKYKL